ncbi:MAG TPA: hypothetical protein VFI03_00950 [Solirubrobacterales bacterium]|nr:hypothetical protein [Solirubrobacterales bacterium]
MTPGLRHLYVPAPAVVGLDPAGAPGEVDGVAVAAVREEWRVDDRWWTPKQLRRHYFELALIDGRSVVVFRCAVTERWYRQRA